MTEKRLTETITDGGIPWINFFNGRLLSGEDLSKEQSSNLEGRRRLGRAIGEGVATGLEVAAPEKGVNTRVTPYVIVEPGLAINRQGQTLSLAAKTQVKLTRPVNADTGAAGNVDFDDCQPLQPGVYVAEAGVYLLTIAPARKNEGRAAVSGLDNIIARCNTHHAVEGVQFRLIQLGLNKEELTDPDHPNQLRNRIAYQCFGINDISPPVSFPVDPFSQPSPRPTLLDDLRPQLLTDCDVPLAIINWTSAEGIKFVDTWSVRRRVFAPGAAGRWDALIGEQRRSEGEAIFLQFQEQVRELAGTESSNAVAARTHFQYLPSVGVLPITASPLKGFDYLKFFDGITYREPVYLEGARVETLLRDSWSYPPVDLSSGEMFWLYWVRENAQAILQSSVPMQTCLIFASGQMPFAADPRFDVARWNYSNFV